MNSQTTLPTTVDQYAVYEIDFTAGEYAHPYRDIEAAASITLPDGGAWTVPLFFDGQTDGGSTWRLRLSPDQPGAWTYHIASADGRLNGLAGEFECVASDKRGGIEIMAGHPYHFQRQDGTPLWFMGDTAWALYTDNADKQHDRAAVQHYIDTRAGQGFNAMHSMLISEAGWGNAGGDAFHDLQAETINPAYWQEVDERVRRLNDKGITAGLVLAWADKGRNYATSWHAFPSQEARVRYARYITARYSAFDVYFIVAGEWDADHRTHDDWSEQESRKRYVEIGQTVREHDPHGRLIAIHPLSTGTVREWASEDWIDFGDYQQQYPRIHAELLRSRGAEKPVINSEYAYYLRDQNEDGLVDKDNSTDIDTMRQATWDIVMAGGYIVTGFGSTYFGGYRHPHSFDVDDPKNDDWEAQIQHIPALFTDLDWWELEPADDAIRSETPRSEDRQHPNEGGRRPLWQPPAVAYWALSDGAGQCVAYVRGVTEPVVIEPGFKGGQIEQFNPRTGERTEAAVERSGESLTYTPPDAQDWVLVARKSDQ